MQNLQHIFSILASILGIVRAKGRYPKWNILAKYCRLVLKYWVRCKHTRADQKTGDALCEWDGPRLYRALTLWLFWRQIKIIFGKEKIQQAGGTKSLEVIFRSSAKFRQLTAPSLVCCQLQSSTSSSNLDRAAEKLRQLFISNQ